MPKETFVDLELRSEDGMTKFHVRGTNREVRHPEIIGPPQILTISRNGKREALESRAPRYANAYADGTLPDGIRKAPHGQAHIAIQFYRIFEGSF